MGLAAAAPMAPALARRPVRRGVVDLTHRLVKTFPSFLGPQAVFDQVLFTIEEDGFYTKQWTVDEHIGTHIDTPGHFALGRALVDELDPTTLIAPIVVVDIRRKAMSDPNATVEPEDLVAFERRHGRIPRGALVCMNSGWADKVDDAEAFRGGAGFPDLNFPGFSVDATDWLLARRHVVGIGVDTMSLDPGNSTTFDVHVSFLGSDKYGVENLTNLDRLPPKGALGFVGPIPWEEGSGSPCRVLARVPGRRASS
jgi:kynurenine formamidase